MNPTALVVMFLLLVTSLFSRMLKEYHGVVNGEPEPSPKEGTKPRKNYSPGSKR